LGLTGYSNGTRPGVTLGTLFEFTICTKFLKFEGKEAARKVRLLHTP
jgi:hypothetical protein